MAQKDAGEKSEAATPKKLQDARDKGQIARSKELTTALLLMAAASALYFFSAEAGSSFGQIAKKAFSPDRRFIFNSNQLPQALGELFSEVASAVAPFFYVLFIIGILSPLLLGGISLSGKALAPKANRMSFAKGLKRMFGTHAAIELVKALAKIAVVFVVAYFVMINVFPTLITLGQGSVETGISSAMKIVSKSFFLLSLSLIVIAIIDVPYQIWNHAKELKMSKQEV